MAGSFKNPLSPGEKLQHGKYIVIEVLGQGFFSITYLVTQLFLNKRMILHEFFLRDHFSRTDNGEVESTLLDETIYSGFRDRWFEEAKMVAKCSQNEHIAPVLDTFEENRTLYFVTEYMNEENLHSYTLEKEEKKLTEEEALELLTQIADGISFLHAQSVFHLALNPRNILIGKNKKITIVNFGIDFQDIPAEVVPDTSLLTRPGYSPPEFYRSPSRPGVFSDIYSLGAILYFLLTGKDPLPANERASGSDAGQKWMLPGISDKMSRTIRKAMSLKPEERYPDVGDFIRDLQEKRPVHRATTGMKPVYLAAAVVAGILLGSAALFMLFRSGGSSAGGGRSSESLEQTDSPMQRGKLAVKQDLKRGMVMLADSGSKETAAGRQVMIGKYYALIIGVEAYTRFEKLNEPVNDAQKIYDILSQDYTFNRENMIFLKNPPRDSIYAALQYLRKTTTPDDNLLVFYSGHGLYDKEEDVGHILPVDADRNNPANWISFKELRTKFKVIAARHILMITDACYGGSLLRGGEDSLSRAIKGEMALDLVKARSRKAFTSAYLKPVPDKSDFARYMFLCLKNNKEKVLLAEDLYYLTKNSIRHSTSNQMPPKFGTLLDCDDEGGDFVFIRR